MTKKPSELSKLLGQAIKKTKGTKIPPAASSPPKVSAPAPTPARVGSKQRQMIVRVPETILTRANMLVSEMVGMMSQAVFRRQMKVICRVTPNRLLLVAVMRWDRVNAQDVVTLTREGGELRAKFSAIRSGRPISGDHEMKAPMTLPQDEEVQSKLHGLQEQFIQQGMQRTKYSANLPAIARLALTRWDRVTEADVKLFCKLFCE